MVEYEMTLQIFGQESPFKRWSGSNESAVMLKARCASYFAGDVELVRIYMDGSLLMVYGDEELVLAGRHHGWTIDKVPGRPGRKVESV